MDNTEMKRTMSKKHVVIIDDDPSHDVENNPSATNSHSHSEAELRKAQRDAYDGSDIREQIAHQREEASAASSATNSVDFVVRADKAFVDAHSRGKKPRFDGFSMRHWNEQCKVKYAKNSNDGTGMLEFADRGDEQSIMIRLPPMTPAEVMMHSEPDDLYMVIRGIVYDCTAWQRFHPGGEAIIRACAGRDGTEVYDFYHKWVDCAGLLGAYAVGRLVGQ